MPEETSVAHLTVTFNDGTVQTYSLTENPGGATQMVSRIKDIMESTFLALELDNKLLMIPASSIRSIEVSPAPLKLPDTVLKNARLID